MPTRRPPPATSSAREEVALVERLSQRFDVPAVASCAAAAAALRTHGNGQVQLVHPPWFDDEFHELGAAYFRRQGFDVAVTKAVGLRAEPARVEPQRVIDWVEQHVEDRAEAVFLARNGFRAAGAIEELELRTRRLVLEANQALLWAILAATGTRWDVTRTWSAAAGTHLDDVEPPVHEWPCQRECAAGLPAPNSQP